MLSYIRLKYLARAIFCGVTTSTNQKINDNNWSNCVFIHFSNRIQLPAVWVRSDTVRLRELPSWQNVSKKVRRDHLLKLSVICPYHITPTWRALNEIPQFEVRQRIHRWRMRGYRIVDDVSQPNFIPTDRITITNPMFRRIGILLN